MIPPGILFVYLLLLSHVALHCLRCLLLLLRLFNSSNPSASPELMVCPCLPPPPLPPRSPLSPPPSPPPQTLPNRYLNLPVSPIRRRAYWFPPRPWQPLLHYPFPHHPPPPDVQDICEIPHHHRWFSGSWLPTLKVLLFPKGVQLLQGLHPREYTLETRPARTPPNNVPPTPTMYPQELRISKIPHSLLIPKGGFVFTGSGPFDTSYGVATGSRIDKIIGLFCKRAL